MVKSVAEVDWVITSRRIFLGPFTSCSGIFKSPEIGILRWRGWRGRGWRWSHHATYGKRGGIIWYVTK